MSVNEKMTAVADAIREANGTTEKMTLDDMATAIPGIADAGKQAGQDAMWDNLQNYGKRTYYNNAFSQTAFSHIDPKYRIVAENAEGFMSESNAETVNWEKFDLSNVYSMYCAFQFNHKLTAIDTDIAVTSGMNTLYNSMCRQCTALQRIQKITAFPSAVWKQTFEGCTSLTHIIFDGTIGANGLNLQWSTGLDRESIESIINALSASTSGLSVTLSQTAVDNAFYDADGSGSSGTGTSTWNDLIGNKDNWTINLV